MVAVVEMFGMPGAGKTTLAAAALPFVDGHTTSDLARDWARLSRVQRSLYIARGFANFESICSAGRLVMHARIRNGESLFRILRLVAKTHWIRSQSWALLLDQGFLQDLWSILYCGKCPDPDPRLLVRLIRSLYRGLEARIFYLEMNPDTASMRIRNRANGASRFDGREETAIRGALARTAGLERALIRAAVDAGLEVVPLDGTAPTALLCEQMRATLSKAR